MNNNYYLAREQFERRIRSGLIGPGSDIFVYKEDIKEEIISDYPLIRYYSGILFPEKGIINSPGESGDIEIANETFSEKDEQFEDFKESKKDESNYIDEISSKETKKTKSEFVDDILKISQNNFFPTNLGLTLCLNNDEININVDFNFGIYHQVDETKAKISISEAGYNLLTNKESTFPFKKIIKYEQGYLTLKRRFEGYRGGRGKERSGEFKIYDAFKKSDELKNQPVLKTYLQLFEKLMGRLWQREEINISKIIPVINTGEIVTIFNRKIDLNNTLRVGYTTKKYKIDDKTYFKVQLINISDKHPPNEFSNKKERLNKKCIFQSSIKIKTNYLLPYKSYSELNAFDNESETLNYLYRDVKNYGIGHNCSVEWENGIQPVWIKTTFLPRYDSLEMKNKLEFNDFQKDSCFKLSKSEFNDIDMALDIYNLSIWGFEKEKLIEKLHNFIKHYIRWIKYQEKNKIGVENIEKRIISNLNQNAQRLSKNVLLLNDEKIYRAFQFANTAMYMQIIVSNDKDFAAAEKDLKELNDEVVYTDLNFFKNYDFSRLSFGKPCYRPFQLAFFILCLDSIVNNDSLSRNDIVDLLWFPTGGGKTEAYLAVTAFNIVWRRLNNETGFEGTSVIMRYTLRLLTAQQFERASRLICALELLRKNYSEELKTESITIGLWVGMSSTPNDVKTAKNKIDKINEECNKGESGDPESKNVFQISSCPWCGTKLITKNKFCNWVSGFEMYKKGSMFRIRCLNELCLYNSILPVQVVDEMLYKNPPTLLFATVDKFARLSWEESGNAFFNSLNTDGLPPDLIIQDELHLISGPLGSISGIYESVIELLCTKNNRKPKIIASTATTRNTYKQVKALYGNRKVNIFPPSGLSHSDYFFAKLSEDKPKRRYLGLMPTGKTLLDTQLKTLSLLLLARLDVYSKFKNLDFKVIDNYWTIVSYYNTLKDVGKIYNKIGDEILQNLKILQNNFYGKNDDYNFNYIGLESRVFELTSRWPSNKIKKILKNLEDKKLKKDSLVIQKYYYQKKLPNGSKKTIEKDYKILKDVIDLVLATNMISAGLDISRLNIMLINNQPKNISEYIQVSSRVSRKSEGLVVTLLDANRSRDKSHFENFIPFHQSLYKFVEPVSVTPFTENTILDSSSKCNSVIC